MAFTYGFFNSFKGDRKYDAEQISEIFDGILKDGIIPSIGQLFDVNTAENGMQITVGTGRAWFDHTWSKNDSVMVLTVPQSDITRPRYDAVVLEVNHEQDVRANAIKIVSGEAAVNPVKPALVNTERVHQYPLAYILVPAAAEAIAAEDIENMVGLEPTVFATGILETVPIDDLWSQWQGEWRTWFEGIKLQLSGDIVTNLQLQIENKVDKADKASLEEALSGTDDTKWMTPLKVRNVLSNVISGKFLSTDDIPYSLNYEIISGYVGSNYYNRFLGMSINLKDTPLIIWGDGKNYISSGNNTFTINICVTYIQNEIIITKIIGTETVQAGTSTISKLCINVEHDTNRFCAIVGISGKVYIIYGDPFAKISITQISSSSTSQSWAASIYHNYVVYTSSHIYSIYRINVETEQTDSIQHSYKLYPNNGTFYWCLQNTETRAILVGGGGVAYLFDFASKTSTTLSAAPSSEYRPLKNIIRSYYINNEYRFIYISGSRLIQLRYDNQGTFLNPDSYATGIFGTSMIDNSICITDKYAVGIQDSGGLKLFVFRLWNGDSDPIAIVELRKLKEYPDQGMGSFYSAMYGNYYTYLPNDTNYCALCVDIEHLESIRYLIKPPQITQHENYLDGRAALIAISQSSILVLTLLHNNAVWFGKLTDRYSISMNEEEQ